MFVGRVFAKRLVGLNRIPLAGIKGVLFVDDLLHGFELPGRRAPTRAGSGIPLFETNPQNIHRRDVPTQQVDESFRRILAGHLMAVFPGQLFFTRRDEADGISPDEQSREQDERSGQPMKPIAPGHGGDAGIVRCPEVRLLENHVAVPADEPGQKLGLAGPAKGLVAKRVGIGRQHDRTGAQRAFNQHRIIIGIFPAGKIACSRFRHSRNRERYECSIVVAMLIHPSLRGGRK
jgi:hypothetical protein